MSPAGLAVGGLCLVLAGVLGLEALPLAVRTGHQGQAPAIVTPGTVAPKALPVAAWAGTVLDRPLFAPDRRPATAATVAAGAPAPLPRLAGTIAMDGTLLAILAPPGGKAVAVRHGTQVSGWTVTQIAPGAVTLAQGGSTATLRLSYADAPTAPPAALPFAPPPFAPRPFAPHPFAPGEAAGFASAPPEARGPRGGEAGAVQP